MVNGTEGMLSLGGIYFCQNALEIKILILVIVVHDYCLNHYGDYCCYAQYKLNIKISPLPFSPFSNNIPSLDPSFTNPLTRLSCLISLVTAFSPLAISLFPSLPRRW